MAIFASDLAHLAKICIKKWKKIAKSKCAKLKEVWPRQLKAGAAAKSQYMAWKSNIISSGLKKNQLINNQLLSVVWVFITSHIKN